MLDKKIAVLTLGCKVNSYDTEAMLELFLEKQYVVVEFDEIADIYLVNTCTVTNLGDKKSRQMLRRAKKQNPDAIVVAAGCYAQVKPEEVAKIPEVDLVIGTKDRASIVVEVESFVKEKTEKNKVTNIMTERVFEPLTVKSLSNRTRAYLKIQEGCNQFCSYCIIPYARGPIRSRKENDVTAEVKILAENGHKEVVLAGIHVASYGKDLGDTSLLDVIKKVHEIDGVERIRFSSVEPRVVTEDFLNEIVKLPKVCNHFHLSLQSGSDKTLKSMNRKYTTDEYRQAVRMLRETISGVSITTDIIVGFPGESDEDFSESFEFVKEMNFAKIHVFPYSPKDNTPAAKFDNQVAQNIKTNRSKQMIELGNGMTNNFLDKHLNAKLRVLFEEQVSENKYVGHTTNYIRVEANSNENLINTICETQAQSVDLKNETIIATVC